MLTIGLVVFASTGLGALLARSDWGTPLVTGEVLGGCRAAACAFFLGAAVLRVARWRLIGEQRSGLTGLALLVLGAVALPLTNARSMEGAKFASPIELARAVTVIAVLTLLALAVLKATADADRLRTGRTTLTITALVTPAIVLAIAMTLWPDAASAVGLTSQGGLVLAQTLAWLAVGLLVARHAGEEAWLGRLSPLLLAMGVAEALRLSELAVWAVTAAMVTVAVSAGSVYGAVQDLVQATKLEQEDLKALSSALVEAEQSASEQQAWRQELTHDARNALAGLRATLETLEKYEQRMTPGDAEHLRAAALGEVGHLEQMIAHEDRMTTDFDVAAVARAVVDARRATGQHIQLFSRPASANGCPGDLATALRNLLVNAEEHGRGAAVTVRIECPDDRVEVIVADQGPGIPAHVGAEMFTRGVSRKDRPGSGLGLYISRTLMRLHGGALEARPSLEGATFALVLPAATARERRRHGYEPPVLRTVPTFIQVG